MDPTITAAIIAGIFTLISPIIYFLFKKFSDKKKRFFNSDRRLSLVGNWHGILYQTIHGHDLKSPVRVEIFRHGNKIKGKANAKFTIPNDKEYSFDYFLTVKFMYDRFLKIEYKNIKKDMINTGVFFLELNPLGNSISGYGVGYGAITQDLTRSNVKLEKSE